MAKLRATEKKKLWVLTEKSTDPSGTEKSYQITVVSVTPFIIAHRRNGIFVFKVGSATGQSLAMTVKILFVTKSDIICIICKPRICKSPPQKKNSMDEKTCTIVTHTIFRKFINLWLTSPSGPIGYSILKISRPVLGWYGSVMYVIQYKTWSDAHKSSGW